MEQNQQQSGLQDRRRSAHGWARVLLFIIAGFAVAFFWLGIVGATSAFMSSLPGTALFTLLGAVVWTIMAVGLLHNGKKMRMIVWVTALVNLVTPLIGLFADMPLYYWSPWRDGGVAFWYVPTVLAAVALWWLYYSSPARLAQRNG